jgi:hypothetical protein
LRTVELRLPLTACVILAIGTTLIMGPGENAERDRKKELDALQKKFNFPLEPVSPPSDADSKQ